MRISNRKKTSAKQERVTPVQRYIDLTNKRFCRLLVLSLLPERAADHSCIWLCRCDCGNEVRVSSYKLRKGYTLSCGCLREEKIKNSRTYVGGTCLEIITSKKINSNNTSGYKGISKNGNRWSAYITYARVTYSLGTYSDIQQAVAVRHEAEQLRLEYATSTKMPDEREFKSMLQKIISRFKE